MGLAVNRVRARLRFEPRRYLQNFGGLRSADMAGLPGSAS